MKPEPSLLRAPKAEDRTSPRGYGGRDRLSRLCYRQHYADDCFPLSAFQYFSVSAFQNGPSLFPLFPSRFGIRFAAVVPRSIVSDAMPAIAATLVRRQERMRICLQARSAR